MRIRQALVLTLPVLWVVLGAMAFLRGDTLYLKDGRLVDGTYLGGTSTTVRFRVDGLITTYQVSDVQEIQFGRVVMGSAGTQTSPGSPSSGSSAAAASVAPTRSGTAGAVASSGAASSTPAPPSDARVGSYRRVAQRDEYVIPAGAVLRVRTTQLVDSDNSQVGDIFGAVLDQNVVVNGELLAEPGSSAKLRLAQLEQAGEFKGRTVLTIDLIEMTVGNIAYELSASPVEEHGEGQGRKAAGKVAGGAALGAIIGAIAGGGKGAAIGAGAGAAAGAGVQVLTRGEKLKIPAETVLEFTLQRDLYLRR
ncbi:MAG: hypothetical protein HY315_01230 [Acidobacteria bacterium]|nr:hypothetical protein [Acidobacteriota bacterium]